MSKKDKGKRSWWPPKWFLQLIMPEDEFEHLHTDEPQEILKKTDTKEDTANQYPTETIDNDNERNAEDLDSKKNEGEDEAAIEEKLDIETAEPVETLENENEEAEKKDATEAKESSDDSDEPDDEPKEVEAKEKIEPRDEKENAKNETVEPKDQEKITETEKNTEWSEKKIAEELSENLAETNTESNRESGWESLLEGNLPHRLEKRSVIDDLHTLVTQEPKIADKKWPEPDNVTVDKANQSVVNKEEAKNNPTENTSPEPTPTLNDNAGDGGEEGEEE